jgi:two-component SAPR family response regulator
VLLRRGRAVERTRLERHCLRTRGRRRRATRRRVNTAIWRLRRLLEPDSVPRESVLTSVGNGLIVSPGCSVWVDVVEFESACHAISQVKRWTDDEARGIVDAVALYRGDFLDGLCTDWALAERGRPDRAIRELERSHEELRRMEARLDRSLQALRRERDAARRMVIRR